MGQQFAGIFDACYGSFAVVFLQVRRKDSDEPEVPTKNVAKPHNKQYDNVKEA
jgi:hypothetical protein